MAYNEKLCGKTHEIIGETLRNHELQLDNHSKKIYELERDGREYKIEIKNLCKKVNDLINTIKWGIGIFITISIFIISLLLKQ